MYQKTLEDIKTQINKSGIKSAVHTCSLFLFFFHICSFCYLKFCIFGLIRHISTVFIKLRVTFKEGLVRNMHCLFLVAFKH